LTDASRRNDYSIVSCLSRRKVLVASPDVKLNRISLRERLSCRQRLFVQPMSTGVTTSHVTHDFASPLHFCRYNGVL